MGIACLAAVLLAASAASAATITVTRPDDPDNATGDCIDADTSCSLREAVNTANSNMAVTMISIPAGTYRLMNQSSGNPLLTISSNIILSGAGPRTTVIKQTANGQNVLNVSTGATVTIQGVTITGGHSGGGLNGGGINSQGTLTLRNSAVTLNDADGTGSPFVLPGDGGGIYNSGGLLTIIRSAISRNHAQAGTGQGAAGGGIFSTYPVHVINSTIADNSADGGSGPASGGGIYMGADAHAQLQLSSATLAFNTASNDGSPQGGNLYIVPSGAGVMVMNSIIAGGTADSGSENCFGASGQLASQGYNLENRNQCAFTGPGDRISIPAKLGLLRNNGGPTSTVALLSGSPAINHGNPSGCTDPSSNPPAAITSDQRGVHRPQGARCDIGAFEFRTPIIRPKPRISGTPKVGQRLTCLLPAVQSPDGPATIAVAWLRSGAADGTGRTHLVTKADQGHSLSCRVKVANAAGAVSATSQPVSVR